MHTVLESTSTDVLVLEFNSLFSPVENLHMSGESILLQSRLIDTVAWTVGDKLCYISL